MTDYNTHRSGDLDAITGTTGVVVSHVAGVGCTLEANKTYYFPFGSQNAATPAQTSLVGSHLKWSAALAATVTLELCGFPAQIGADNRNGTVDVSDYDATAGNFVQENPSTAVVSVSGSGNSATALTITVGGSAAGGATCSLGNFGMRRARWKVVTTVGGVMRVNVHGKAGA